MELFEANDGRVVTLVLDASLFRLKLCSELFVRGTGVMRGVA